METEPGPKKTAKLELAFVIAIVAILAVLFIPSIINLFAKSKEDTDMYNLGVLRTSLAAYYTDNQQYPADNLKSLIAAGKYLVSIPLAIGNSTHTPSKKVTVEPSPSDAGGWSYNNDPTNPAFGSLHIACTHLDSKGVSWSTY
jgi:type II secretory pathway pseudopilin PulG